MYTSIDLNQKNYPIQKIVPFDEQYISRKIFDNITKSCTFPPIAIEEINSELWCYSYDGYGKVTFKDGSVYTGGTKFGILTNEIDKSRPCEILFSDGEKYIGEIIGAAAVIIAALIGLFARKSGNRNKQVIKDSFNSTINQANGSITINGTQDKKE